ncbi:GyrI-like domain-containing protein [Acerihabitans sp. TG2]|uniref:GyrI-like domain-containing protein n=1 Tax=Acerihabitans sp. TG2 TaxID=3096008 RepID=UPI002B22D3EA|nr:GyrI-like domain-containing protein [Acerihabitans sp. TG2]MEA9389874.1 GyrI-like domain-containing protein [Acerihabitans sp. TG2]
MSIKFVSKASLPITGIRVTGPYAESIPLGFDALSRWVERHAIDAKDWVALYWDDPSQVAPQALRADVAVGFPAEAVLPEDSAVTMVKQTIPGGLFAVYHTKVTKDNFSQAWEDFYTALAGSEYHPVKGACFERYLDDGRSGTYEIEIYQSIAKND